MLPVPDRPLNASHRESSGQSNDLSCRPMSLISHEFVSYIGLMAHTT